ncbi:MAG: (2Fe-2S)-binding protein [Rhodanobacteraceae bacterium]
MYVCICNAVTDRDIRNAAGEGVESFQQLQSRTGCGTCCGCCKEEASRLLTEACAENAALPLAA